MWGARPIRALRVRGVPHGAPRVPQGGPDLPTPPSLSFLMGRTHRRGPSLGQVRLGIPTLKRGPEHVGRALWAL